MKIYIKSHYLTVLCFSISLLISCSDRNGIQNAKEKSATNIDNWHFSSYYPENDSEIYTYTGTSYFSTLDTSYPDTIRIKRPTVDSIYISVRLLRFNKLNGELEIRGATEYFSLNMNHRYIDSYKEVEYTSETSAIFLPPDSLKMSHKKTELSVHGSYFRQFTGKRMK
jgi:hypothetical protein